LADETAETVGLTAQGIRDCFVDDGGVGRPWRGRRKDKVEGVVKMNFSFKPLNEGRAALSTGVTGSSAEPKMEEDCVKLGTEVWESPLASVCWDPSSAVLVSSDISWLSLSLISVSS